MNPFEAAMQYQSAQLGADVHIGTEELVLDSIVGTRYAHSDVPSSYTTRGYPAPRTMFKEAQRWYYKTPTSRDRGLRRVLCDSNINTGFASFVRLARELIVVRLHDSPIGFLGSWVGQPIYGTIRSL